MIITEARSVFREAIIQHMSLNVFVEKVENNPKTIINILLIIFNSPNFPIYYNMKVLCRVVPKVKVTQI